MDKDPTSDESTLETAETAAETTAPAEEPQTEPAESKDPEVKPESSDEAASEESSAVDEAKDATDAEADAEADDAPIAGEEKDGAEVPVAESDAEDPEPAADKNPEAAAKEDAEEKAEESAPEKAENAPVDLSALQGFDFGTSWTETKPVGGDRRSSDRRPSRGPRPPRGDRPERKDRRSFKPGGFRKAPRREEGEHRGRPPRAAHGRKPYGQHGHGRPEIPRKVVEVSFYPEDHGFKALCKALRVSTITYELFDIARTILEKDERFYMIIRPVDAKGAPDEEASLFVSESDGLPFFSEEAATQHALSSCLDHFFASETKEVEPPSGSFSSIRKCGFTGELLGPPNFHRIKKIMADHHASRLSNMSYAKFESRIESVTEEEVIAEWLEKMKTQTSYILKEDFGGPRGFEDGESARSFVKANLGEKLVREVKSARVEGTQISKVKEGLLRANLDFSWERQKRFPLDTANLLRGRLRRQRFALYKKGSKGISYVCAVKRRFREPNETFSDAIQALLTFLDENPNIGVKDLAERYLGFVTHAAEGEEPVVLTEEQQAKLKAMTLDFQWLLKEGYIAEYSNGTIFAHPPAGPGQGIVPKKAATAPESEKTDAPASATEEKTDSASKEEAKAEEPKDESKEEAKAETPEDGVEAPKEDAEESAAEAEPEASKADADAEAPAESPESETSDDSPAEDTDAAAVDVEETSDKEPEEEPAEEEAPETTEAEAAEVTEAEPAKAEKAEADSAEEETAEADSADEAPAEAKAEEAEVSDSSEETDLESDADEEAEEPVEVTASPEEGESPSEDPESELKEPAKS